MPTVRTGRLVATALVGVGLWLLPVPDGVEPGAWKLLAIFVATIAGIILRPLPMGAVALVAIGVAVLSRTLTIEEATAGFGAPVVWLVVAAFFIATTFIHTGLGMRIAYHFMRVLWPWSWPRSRESRSPGRDGPWPLHSQGSSAWPSFRS